MGDNWLTTGNCSDCRRKNYCKNPCTKAKRRRANMVYKATMQAIGLDRVLDAMGPRSKEQFDLMAKQTRTKF